MRSIPNLGWCLVLTLLASVFCAASSVTGLFALRWTKLYVFFLFGCVTSHTSRLFMSNPLWVCLFLSVCLSVCLSVSLPCPSLPPSWASPQDIFPPECPTHVGSMSVSSRPSPHHHHTLDALWLPLQRAAWRHQWVLLLRSQSLYLSPFSVICRALWFIVFYTFFSYVAITFCALAVSLLVNVKVVEFCSDLSLILLSDFVVDQTQAVKFALDIACGMAFLHTLEPMIPRHYLNSKSVMVSSCCGFIKAFRIITECSCHVQWLTHQRKLCWIKHSKVRRKEVIFVALWSDISVSVPCFYR